MSTIEENVSSYRYDVANGESSSFSLLQSTGGRRPPPYWGVLLIVTTLGRQVGDRSICTDCVVFTQGAAAHLSDKPLVASYDTHGQIWGDAILLRRHHTANIGTYEWYLRMANIVTKLEKIMNVVF